MVWRGWTRSTQTDGYSAQIALASSLCSLFTRKRQSNTVRFVVQRLTMSETPDTSDEGAEALKKYPSGRTLLPDEISGPLVILAYVISTVVSHTAAEWYPPLVPETIAAAALAFPGVLIGYAILHFASGRRWVVEGAQ